MFRRVLLPTSVPGDLLLHSMPGRYEPFAECKTEFSRSEIGRIVCLAPLDEIREKSPEYFKAIQAGDLSCERDAFEIPDFEVPKDRNGFIQLAKDVSSRLRSGERILIHCAGGIGRTGMLAICVLLALGVDLQEACASIKESGPCPETEPQRELIRWVAHQIPLASGTSRDWPDKQRSSPHILS